MKHYNWQKINELVQPLMKFMQEEYPNNYKFIIERDFAYLEYSHQELMFESATLKEDYGLGEHKNIEEEQSTK